MPSAQRDALDAGRLAEVQREAWPQRGTIVGIERQALDLVQTGHKAVVGEYQQTISTLKHASMGVTGQLQRHRSALRGAVRGCVEI